MSFMKSALHEPSTTLHNPFLKHEVIKLSELTNRGSNGWRIKRVLSLRYRRDAIVEYCVLIVIVVDRCREHVMSIVI